MYLNNQIKEAFFKLGKHITKLREYRNMTIKEVSIKTGIRKEYLHKIELGTAYGVLLEKHLLKIAKALKIKISTLFDFEKIVDLSSK